VRRRGVKRRGVRRRGVKRRGVRERCGEEGQRTMPCEGMPASFLALRLQMTVTIAPLTCSNRQARGLGQDESERVRSD
jgi:hypothetical protein